MWFKSIFICFQTFSSNFLNQKFSVGINSLVNPLSLSLYLSLSLPLFIPLSLPLSLSFSLSHSPPLPLFLSLSLSLSVSLSLFPSIYQSIYLSIPPSSFNPLLSISDSLTLLKSYFHFVILSPISIFRRRMTRPVTG